MRHNDELLLLTVASRFCRPHPAEEVYVTGTFDDWKKTEELEKVGGIFEKKVKLLVASEKIYYKVGAMSLLSPLFLWSRPARVSRRSRRDKPPLAEWHLMAG